MTTPRAVEKARADVARLMQVEVDLSHRRVAKLVETGAPDGGCLLAGELAGDAEAMAAAAERVTRVAGEAAALASAIDAARRARTPAITAAWHAEAELKREEAVKLRTEAGARQVKTDEMLAALAEFEKVGYVPGPRSQGLAPGTPLSRQPIFGVDSNWPLTVQLMLQADRLDEEAAQLETRAIVRAGAVSGNDAEALFAAVASNPFILGPTLDEISAWIAAKDPAFRSKWRIDRLTRHLPVDEAAWRAAGKYMLVWKAAGVDFDRSGVTVSRERDAEGVAI